MQLAQLAVVVALAVGQPAPPVSVLASGAAEGTVLALGGIVPDATTRFETSQGIAARLAAGEMPDVLIAQSSIVDQLIAGHRAEAASRVALGRMPIGMAVAANAARPDISTPAALRTVLLAAGEIVISQGASGTVVEQLFSQMGIANQIGARIRREPRGDDVIRRVAASGAGAIGFTMVSEIKYGERHGARYASPLPEVVQTYTSYDAVVMSTAKSPDAARAFVRALASDKARRVLSDNGWVR